MNLLIMGPPGAGKGSQAKLINETYHLPHISTGAMFREEIASNSKLGVLASKFIDKGELVPDKVTSDLVKERLQEADCNQGFLLDGFPRTIEQARTLDEILKGLNKKLDRVINLVVGDEILIKRISGRRVCGNCGQTYHIEGKKPKIEGVCDSCGSALMQRADDTPETVTNRIKVYYKETKPLIDYYQAQGILIDIDGVGNIEDIFKKVQVKLEAANDFNKK